MRTRDDLLWVSAACHHAESACHHAEEIVSFRTALSQ